jgi:hypothetical protein
MLYATSVCECVGLCTIYTLWYLQTFLYTRGRFCVFQSDLCSFVINRDTGTHAGAEYAYHLETTGIIPFFSCGKCVLLFGHQFFFLV